jgi:hypothetical protein
VPGPFADRAGRLGGEDQDDPLDTGAPLEPNEAT